MTFLHILKNEKAPAINCTGFSAVLKANPYHDERGRFTTESKAKFVSTGPAFSASIAKQKAALAKAKAADAKIEYNDEQDILAIKKRADDYLTKTSKQWDSLTREEKEAVQGYTGMGGGTSREGYYYEVLNSTVGILKGDETLAPKHTKNKMKVMDSALSKGELPENAMLYKAIDLSHAGINVKQNSSDAEYKSLVGKVITDHAYGSTSIERSTAVDFMKSSRVLMQIEAKKGTKGMWVGGSKDRTEYDKEYEFILPRNTAYKIKGIKKVVIGGREFTLVQASI